MRALQLALLVAPLALAGCGSSPAAQPGAPQVLMDRSIAAQGTTYRVTVDQESYPPHYTGLLHTHPGPGSFCILQGQLRMEVVGQAPVDLSPGQCWPEPPGVAHRPVNDSDQQAVAVFYLFAPSGEPRIAPAGSTSP